LKPLGHFGLTPVTFLVVLPFMQVMVVFVVAFLPPVIATSADDCFIAIVPRLIV